MLQCTTVARYWCEWVFSSSVVCGMSVESQARNVKKEMELFRSCVSAFLHIAEIERNEDRLKKHTRNPMRQIQWIYAIPSQSNNNPSKIKYSIHLHDIFMLMHVVFSLCYTIESNTFIRLISPHIDETYSKKSSSILWN